MNSPHGYNDDTTTHTQTRVHISAPPDAAVTVTMAGSSRRDEASRSGRDRDEASRSGRSRYPPISYTIRSYAPSSNTSRSNAPSPSSNMPSRYAAPSEARTSRTERTTRTVRSASTSRTARNGDSRAFGRADGPSGRLTVQNLRLLESRGRDARPLPGEATRTPRPMPSGSRRRDSEARRIQPEYSDDRDDEVLLSESIVAAYVHHLFCTHIYEGAYDPDLLEVLYPEFLRILSNHSVQEAFRWETCRGPDEGPFPSRRRQR